MRYNFMITEYLRRSVRVEADSKEEAYQKVEDLVSSDRILLTDADFSDRDIQILDDDESYDVDDDFSAS